MNRSFKIASTLAALAAAVASHAVIFSFGGQTTSGVTIPGSFTTTPPPGPIGAGAPFSTLTSGFVTLANSNVISSNVVFTNGTDTVTVTFTGTSDDVAPGLAALSSTGTITAGTGVFASYVSPTNALTVTSNTYTGTGLNFFSVLGNVNAVPEPTSLAAFGVGAVALLRRRKKA